MLQKPRTYLFLIAPYCGHFYSIFKNTDSLLTFENVKIVMVFSFSTHYGRTPTTDRAVFVSYEYYDYMLMCENKIKRDVP